MALNIARLEKQIQSNQPKLEVHAQLELSELVVKVHHDLHILESRIGAAREVVEALGADFEKVEPVKLLIGLQQDVSAVKDLLLNVDSFLSQLRGNADAEAELIAAAQAKLRSI